MVFPPELLEQMVELSLPPPGPRRNSTLATLATVSSTFAAIAQRLLLANLTLEWRVTTANLLLRTFDDDPSLLLLVRSLSVNYTSSHAWTRAWLDARRGTWTVTDEEDEWHRRPVPDGDEDVLVLDETWARWSNFEARKAEWATDALRSSGDAEWMLGARERRVGATAFFALVGRCRNLQSLSVQDFTEEDAGARSGPPTLATQAVLSQLTSFRTLSAQWKPPCAFLLMLHGASLRHLTLDTISLFPPSDPTDNPSLYLLPHLTSLRTGFDTNRSATSGSTSLLLLLLSANSPSLTSVEIGPEVPFTPPVLTAVFSLPGLTKLVYHRDARGGPYDPEIPLAVAQGLVTKHLREGLSGLEQLDLDEVWPHWPLLEAEEEGYEAFLDALPAGLEEYGTTYEGEVGGFESFLGKVLERRKMGLGRLRRVRIGWKGAVPEAVDEVLAATRESWGVVEVFSR